ncbi:MAG TPA: hypothetical protein VF911_14715 [Thermoanaerobaculia bacterium]|jgi:hypothetical protein
MGAIVYIAACLIVAFIARHRLLGFWGALLCSLLLTPIFVAIVLILFTPRVMVRWRRRETTAG